MLSKLPSLSFFSCCTKHPPPEHSPLSEHSPASVDLLQDICETKNSPIIPSIIEFCDLNSASGLSRVSKILSETTNELIHEGIFGKNQRKDIKELGSIADHLKKPLSDDQTPTVLFDGSFKFISTGHPFHNIYLDGKCEYTAKIKNIDQENHRVIVDYPGWDGDSNRNQEIKLKDLVWPNRRRLQLEKNYPLTVGATVYIEIDGENSKAYIHAVVKEIKKNHMVTLKDIQYCEEPNKPVTIHKDYLTVIAPSDTSQIFDFFN